MRGFRAILLTALAVGLIVGVGFVLCGEVQAWPWSHRPQASLTVTPDKREVGERVTWEWDSANGTPYLDDEIVTPSGSLNEAVMQTTTKTLVVKKGLRRSAIAQATVTVVAPQPPLGKWQVGYPASIQTVKAVTVDDAIAGSVPPAPEVKAIKPKVRPQQARAPPKKYMRGLVPTSKPKLMAAMKAGEPLMAKLRALPPPPENFDGSGGCRDFTMFGNDMYGDCTTAEEAAAKRVISMKTGASEVIIPDANVIAYCRQYGGLNGADLNEVLDRMTVHGLRDAAGKEHKDDATAVALDGSKKLIVQLAIYYTGELKVGIAANQVENADTGLYGWTLLNARRDQSEDHCVGYCGYGSLEFCCHTLGVAVPKGADPKQFCLIMYTWATLGIVSWDSTQNITWEWWMRGTDPDRADADAWRVTYAKVMADLIHGNVTPPDAVTWTVTYPVQAAVTIEASDAADAVRRVPYTGKPTAVQVGK